MNVLVLGGTGFVGSALVRELATRGHAVTVLARSPPADGLPDGVDFVAGDVTDYASIEPAFDGEDAVVNLVALSPLFTPSGGPEMHDRVHLGGTENAVRAAEEHGVRKLVQLSALGADPDGPTAYIRAKGRAEEVVRESALDWTIVRPSVVFGDGGEFVRFTRLLTTPYVAGLPGGGATRFQPIWVGDVAPMLAAIVEGHSADSRTESGDSVGPRPTSNRTESGDSVGPRPTGNQNSESSGDDVEDDRHAGETYELGGPEVLTLADVARLAYRAEGKPLTVLSIPMPLARVGMGLARFVPGVPFGPDQYRSLQFDNTVADDDVTAFGRDPGALRTLRDYLDEHGEGEPTGDSTPASDPTSA